MTGIAVDRPAPARKRRVSRFSWGPPEHVMQVPLPREALERSDRSGESSLPVAAGHDGASHQISVTERGVVHPKSRPLRAEGGARGATEPARVCSGAARALPRRHPSREGGPAGRGRRRHRPAPQGGDPIAAAGAAGAHGPLARWPPAPLRPRRGRGGGGFVARCGSRPRSMRPWTASGPSPPRIRTAMGLPRSRPPLRSPLLRAPRQRPR